MLGFSSRFWLIVLVVSLPPPPFSLCCVLCFVFCVLCFVFCVLCFVSDIANCEALVFSSSISASFSVVDELGVVTPTIQGTIVQGDAFNFTSGYLELSLPLDATRGAFSANFKANLEHQSNTTETLLAMGSSSLPAERLPTIVIKNGTLLSVSLDAPSDYPLTELGLDSSVWHHLIVSWSGGRVFFLVDGRLVKEAVFVAPTLAPTVWVGNGFVGSAYFPFLGELKNVRLWSTPLFNELESHVNVTECLSLLGGWLLFWCNHISTNKNTLIKQQQKQNRARKGEKCCFEIVSQSSRFLVCAINSNTNIHFTNINNTKPNNTNR